MIFGDYDVDGVTGTAILVRTLLALEPDAAVTHYIPHRLEEGYGLNDEAVRALAADGAKVIVSVDCGVTAHSPAEVAKQLGVDLIITDHHNPPATLEDLPSAFAVVHPRRPDSAYPFGELCGAGVAYKLAWRLATMHAGTDRVHDELRTLLVELLGFAALGTVADIVPLLDENRAVVRFGLVRLKHSPFVGVRALVEASGLAGGSIAEEDVGFRLGPRLNAAGRLGHAREALELMLSSDADRCRLLAEELSRRNEERRAVERSIVKQAKAAAVEHGMDDARTKVVVLRGSGWHPGVLGIVCSRLVEAYHKPVVLLTEEDGILKGSARSIEGFNLHGALDACSDHLSTFGGHDMAAGLSLEADRFDAFAGALLRVSSERLTEDDLVPTVTYDTHAALEELTPDAVNAIQQLGPFGAGNPRVTLRVRGILERPPRGFGKTGDHAEVLLRSAEKSRSGVLRLIGWNWSERLAGSGWPAGTPVEAVIEPKLSSYRGSVSVEPILRDLARLPG